MWDQTRDYRGVYQEVGLVCCPSLGFSVGSNTGKFTGTLASLGAALQGAWSYKD